MLDMIQKGRIVIVPIKFATINTNKYKFVALFSSLFLK